MALEPTEGQLDSIEETVWRDWWMSFPKPEMVRAQARILWPLIRDLVLEKAAKTCEGVMVGVLNGLLEDELPGAKRGTDLAAARIRAMGRVVGDERQCHWWRLSEDAETRYACQEDAGHSGAHRDAYGGHGGKWELDEVSRDIAQLRRDRDELVEVLEQTAARLARRIANEKHGADCSNCEADKELVVAARTLLARIRGSR